MRNDKGERVLSFLVEGVFTKVCVLMSVLIFTVTHCCVGLIMDLLQLIILSLYSVITPVPVINVLINTLIPVVNGHAIVNMSIESA